MQYTTLFWERIRGLGCFIRISKILLYAIHNEFDALSGDTSVVLSGFQRYFCMQYTTARVYDKACVKLFYQDFKDTFVCNTQLLDIRGDLSQSCFIRISKILLYAIHNTLSTHPPLLYVVLSGFQRYFCMQYTTRRRRWRSGRRLFYQDFNEQFVCKSTKNKWNMQIYLKIFAYQKAVP